MATALGLMKQPAFAFLGEVVGREDMGKFRKLVIELVLATDMKGHFAHAAKFAAIHRTSGAGADVGGGGVKSSAVMPADDNERVLNLQMALKVRGIRWWCLLRSTFRPSLIAGPGAQKNNVLKQKQLADLGHVAESTEVHQQWVERLQEE